MGKFDELVEEYMMLDKKTLAEMLALIKFRDEKNDNEQFPQIQPNPFPLTPIVPYYPQVPQYPYPYITWYDITCMC